MDFTCGIVHFYQKLEAPFVETRIEYRTNYRSLDYKIRLQLISWNFLILQNSVFKIFEQQQEFENYKNAKFLILIQ